MKPSHEINVRCAMSLILACLLASACAYDFGDHPMACETTADCDDGHYCFAALCIPASSSGGAGTSSTAGASGGTSSGVIDAGGHMTAADGGTQTQADAALQDAASGQQDAGNATGSTDAGPIAVEPYADCTGNADCNLGETCRVIGSQGVCAAPCTAASQCSAPTSGSAVPTCGADGRCRLTCATDVRGGGGPSTSKTCPSGMTCVVEAPAWQGGEQICYP